jgi:hypothetical protein
VKIKIKGVKKEKTEVEKGRTVYGLDISLIEDLGLGEVLGGLEEEREKEEETGLTYREMQEIYDISK